MTNAHDFLCLGLDFGTSGVRAILLDADQQVVAQHSTPMSVGGANPRAPEVWWQTLEHTLRGLRAAHPDALTRVRALAIDGTSGTMLPVNASGQPLAEALMYNDPVTDPDLLDAIAREAPKESAAHGATSGLAKLLQLQGTPDVHKVLHQADWAAGRLMGDFRFSDENNALKTGYDPISRAWPEWLSRTAAQVDLLPEVKEPGSPLGPLAPDWAEAFGLPPETLVVAGSTDGCAAFLATGASEVGDGVTSLGSTLVVKLLCEAPIFAPEFGIYSHRLGSTWLAGGASNTGGAVLAHFFSNEELATLSRALDPEHPTGLDYYPLLKRGERFPLNDPNLDPRLDPRPEDDHLFLQGMLEGMARIETLAYRQLAQLGAPALQSVRTVGGGANNPGWTTIRQSGLQVPMLPVASEAAASGAARLAWQGWWASGGS